MYTCVFSRSLDCFACKKLYTLDSSSCYSHRVYLLHILLCSVSYTRRPFMPVSSRSLHHPCRLQVAASFCIVPGRLPLVFSLLASTSTWQDQAHRSSSLSHLNSHVSLTKHHHQPSTASSTPCHQSQCQTQCAPSSQQPSQCALRQKASTVWEKSVSKPFPPQLLLDKSLLR